MQSMTKDPPKLHLEKESKAVLICYQHTSAGDKWLYRYMGLIEDVHMWLPQITTRATVLVITLLYVWNMYAYKILILIHMLSNCNIYIQDHLHNIMEFSVCTRQHFDVWLIYLAVLIVINHDAMYWLYLKLSFFKKMFPSISKSNTGRWN